MTRAPLMDGEPATEPHGGAAVGSAHDRRDATLVPPPETFPLRDVPETMTAFAHLARHTPYRAAVRRMVGRQGGFRLLEMDLPRGLVEDLRLAVVDAMKRYGHAGWRSKEGESARYGGFSLVANPDHGDGLDPHVGTLGSPLNAAHEFYYNQRDGHLPVKNSYFDTYGFRHRTAASRHGALGEFLDGLSRSLVRSRVGIIYGENVDPDDANYRANAGWHRDEPVYQNLRVNIPLQTDDSFVLEIEGEPPRHLAPGKAYSWDTHIPHRVYCRGRSPLQRIHLVLGLAPWFDYLASEDAWRPNGFFGEVHPFDMLRAGEVHPLIRESA